MNANIRTIGGALGGAVLASVITAGHRPDGYPVESGYVTGFTLLVVTVSPVGTRGPRRARGEGAHPPRPGPQADAEALQAQSRAR
jgi:hypothetical protein